jgi:psp operon transcriptional activator
MTPPTSRLPPLVGESPAFQAMLEHVSRAAPLDKPTLVIGERGTGKELVAARLHYLSRRWDRPFIKLNCGALSESLLESELFGHEAGAFTGAVRRHAGRFELADGGTLFLDEIANASAAVQEKILRVIEYGEFERVGGRETLITDVRLIGATNADLPALAAAGRFRADLLDRLAFDVITIPPLRARGEDIPILADHFAVAMARELERPFFPGFTERALDTLRSHDWPGNVRELKNTVERAVYRAEPGSPAPRNGSAKRDRRLSRSGPQLRNCSAAHRTGTSSVQPEARCQRSRTELPPVPRLSPQISVVGPLTVSAFRYSPKWRVFVRIYPLYKVNSCL